MNIELIKEWISSREPHGIVKLAAAAEISPQTITNILVKGHQPRIDIARRISKAMNVSLDELCASPTQTETRVG